LTPFGFIEFFWVLFFYLRFLTVRPCFCYLGSGFSSPAKVAAAAGVAMAGNGTVWLQSLLLSSMHWQRCLLHC